MRRSLPPSRQALRRASVLLISALLLPAASPAQELLPVPLLPLDTLEPVVARQIDEALQATASARNASRGIHAEAYGALAQVLHAYEFVEGADAAYENARRLAPRDYRWPHLLGYLRQQTGEFEQAIDLYLQALSLEPADHVAALHLGDAYLQLDRRGEARSRFESVRSRFPASAMAGLGEIALRERRFADAVRLFEDVLRLAPHATRLHYSMGMAYRGLGRIDDARARLERAGQGRVRPADALLDALPGLLRGYRALLNQARVELQAGAVQAAGAMFTRALAAAPDSMEEGATIELAIRLVDEQHLRDAVTLLTAAYDRFPDRDGIATTLARMLAASPDVSLRNGTRALAIATQVYARSATPAHGETMALALAELGRCDDALRWMRRAVADAERGIDASELTRLKAGLPAYQTVPCRSP